MPIAWFYDPVVSRDQMSRDPTDFQAWINERKNDLAQVGINVYDTLWNRRVNFHGWKKIVRVGSSFKNLLFSGYDFTNCKFWWLSLLVFKFKRKRKNPWFEWLIRTYILLQYRRMGAFHWEGYYRTFLLCYFKLVGLTHQVELEIL